MITDVAVTALLNELGIRSPTPEQLEALAYRFRSEKRSFASEPEEPDEFDHLAVSLVRQALRLRNLPRRAVIGG